MLFALRGATAPSQLGLGVRRTWEGLDHEQPAVRYAGHCLMRTHGMSSRPEYRAWIRMWQRVKARPTHPDYKTYVLNNVRVAARWSSFESFFVDMGPRPSACHSLDRYPDPRGNYAPGNVRWATQREQQNNKRNNHRVTFDGLCLTLSEWARRTRIRKDTLRLRLEKGWSVERALTTPTREWRRG